MATKPSTLRKGAMGGNAALDRLSGSIEAAQQALRDLRRELGKGERDVLKDLEEMQKAAAGKRPRSSAARAPAKRTTTAKSATTSSPRKTTGQRAGGARNT